MVLLLPAFVSAAGRDINLPVIALDLGSVAVGSNSTATYTIENVGGAALGVSSITSDNPEFNCNPTLATIPGGNFETITVTFAPLTTGIKSATVTILSNDPDEPSLTVTLSGTGTTPPWQEINLPSTLVPVGDVFVGQSGSGAFTIENQGAVDLTVSSIISDHAFFTVNPTSATILPGQNQIVTVTFAPTNAGNQTATITVASDDGDEPSLTVSATAKGIAAAPEITLSTVAVDAGNVNIGGNGTATFTITNDGTANLAVSGISSDNARFAVSPASVTLTPAQSQTVTVTFSPLAAGAQSATITVASNDADEPSLTISAAGTGSVVASPEITLSTLSVNAGNVSIGGSGTATFTITNDGTADLVVSGISSDNARFAVSPASVTLTPAQSQTVTITFSPLAAGAQSSTITVASNDGDEPVKNITAVGNGTTAATPEIIDPVIVMAPEIDLSLTNINMGAVIVGSSSSLEFQISNSGSAGLEVSSITVDNGSFSVSPGGMSIQEGQSGAVRIEFKPETIGKYSASIKINSSDEDEQVLTVLATGECLPLPEPQISVSTYNLNLGTVEVGARTSSLFFIKNNGSADLIVSKIFAENNAFSVYPNQATIPPLSLQYITVFFNPGQAGSYSSAIVTNNNDPDEGNRTIRATAIAVDQIADPVVSFSTEVLELEADSAATRGSTTFYIYNKSSEKLTISSVQCDLPGVSIAYLGDKILAGDSFAVTVVLNPELPDYYSGIVSIVAEGATGGKQTFSIQLHADLVRKQPQIQLAAELLNFGNVISGQRVSSYLTVANTGTAELIAGFSLQGSNTFKLLRESLSLLPGSHDSIEISFQPDSVGVFNASLEIESNDNQYGVLAVNLTGSGQPMPAPEIVLTADTGKEIIESGGEFDLGQVCAGQNTTFAFSIGNSGNEILRIMGIVTDNQLFTTSQINSEIAPGNQENMLITFQTPEKQGEFKTKIIVASNAGNGKIISFSLSASVIQPINAKIVVSSDEINFGNISSDTASSDLLITNTGTCQVTLQSISAEPGCFVAGKSSFALAPGDTSLVEILFIPDSAGSYSGLLTLTILEYNEPLRIKLIGNCIEKPSPVIRIFQDSLIITDTWVGEQSAAKVEILNTGTEILRIMSASITGDDFLIAENPDSIAPGGTRELKVLFSPASAGVKSTDLKIFSNDLLSPSVSLKILARANDRPLPEIKLSANELVIDALLNEPSIRTTFTITNTGTDELIIYKIVAPDPNYTIEPESAVIKAGDALSVHLMITAAPDGNHLDTLRILSNDPDNNEIMLDLSYSISQPVVKCSLQQNFPNPFNPSTTVNYAVSTEGPVTLNIYDLRGRMIIQLVNKLQQPGNYSINWDGRDWAGRPAASGVYFYRLQAGDFSQTRKMMLLK